MDPLSDALSLLKPRIHGAEGLDWGGRWSVEFGRHEGLKCYAVVSGECLLIVDGIAEAVPVRAGECFLLPQGRPFRLASDLETISIPSTDCAADGGIHVWEGGGRCFMVGGHFFLANDHAAVMLGALPPIVHIRDERHRAALRWALEAMRHELEDKLPGASLVAQHLAHMILIQALRLHVATAPAGGVGWLFALADRQISAAISAIHDDPSYRWTLPALAERSGMSRSAFALRFRELAGETPMRYVTRWRMLLAADKLANSQESVSMLSRSLGYDTETAFSTAFKRTLGCSPREYRRDRRSIGVMEPGTDASSHGQTADPVRAHRSPKAPHGLPELEQMAEH